MKNRLFKFFLYFALGYLLVMVSYVFYQNYRLTTIIDRQNTLLKATTGKDIDFIVRAQTYKDSINRITNKLAFIMNGDSLTASKFVVAYEKIEHERDSLDNQYKDLLATHKFAEEMYGFKIRTTKSDLKLNLSIVPFTKADSAAVALEVFRKRLKVTKKGWVIDFIAPEKEPKFKIEMGDPNKQKKGVTDSTNAEINQ